MPNDPKPVVPQNKRKHMKGAKPSPAHRIASAKKHTIKGKAPLQMIIIPPKLSMWLNDVDGDCVTAEEAFAKSATTSPEVFITDQTVQTWATKNGFLDGADLISVLDLMETSGFVQDGITYNDGPATYVDFTDLNLLRNAISQGPVKIGIASDQLDNVPNIGESNGWFATGFSSDSNEDHCTSLCGYGPISWLASELGVTVPSGVDGTQPGFAMFTWDTIGIIGATSLLNITAEAWLRTPTTAVVNPPTPTPPPPPTPPTPTPQPPVPTPPNPSPVPSSTTLTITDGNGVVLLSLQLPLSVSVTPGLIQQSAKFVKHPMSQIQE